MQFKVPQNIDLEDRIVGPLTLVQFLYCLGGGLLIYILFQTLASQMLIFFLLAMPIAIVTISLAFIKIQDQPFSHFVKAGIYYMSHPKVRYWKKVGVAPIVLVDVPKKVTAPTRPERKRVEKSDLEKLAYILDTQPLNNQEQRNFGKITASFEKMIQDGLNMQSKRRPGQQTGGAIGAMGQTPNTKH